MRAHEDLGEDAYEGVGEGNREVRVRTTGTDVLEYDRVCDVKHEGEGECECECVSREVEDEEEQTTHRVRNPVAAASGGCPALPPVL